MNKLLVPALIVLALSAADPSRVLAEDNAGADPSQQEQTTNQPPTIPAQENNPDMEIIKKQVADLAAENDKSSKPVSLSKKPGKKDDIIYISMENAPLDRKGKKAVNLASEWQTRPVMPAAEEKDGAVTYTFGATEPTIVCRPMMVCVLRLELGEKLIDEPHCGDNARWDITPSKPDPSRPPHIYIKAKDSGLVTNLAINTDKRTYMISLKSRNDRYTPLVAFRYPENEKKAWDAYMADQRRQEDETNRNKRFGAAGQTFDASKLDFRYSVTGDDTRWKPLRVFNDGRKTYVQMPSIMEMYEAPVLLTINDGTESLVNYRLHGDTFIVDQLFDKAVLLSGVGGSQSKITITRADTTASLK